MKSRQPINRSSMRVSALAIITVLAFWYFARQNTSPGEISAAHSLPSLVGSGSCSVCHGKGDRGMRKSCLKCHQEIDRQLSRGTGFHGLISADLAGDCAKCHSEHHGRDFRTISEQSFALAGIDAPERFDHAGLDFVLTGRHLEIACIACHRFAGANLLPKGQRRFLGLNQRCKSCHQDVHEERFGAACASCHGQSRPFHVVAEFEHTSEFRLDAAHGYIACVDCHEPGTNYGIRAHLARRRQPGGEHPPRRTCRACHFSPHNDSLLVAVAQGAKSPPEQSCEHCHLMKDESFFGNQESMAGDRHAVTGFPLAPAHDAVSCEACHEGFGEPKASMEGFLVAYPGRSPDDCAACHVDPHQGQFADSRSGGGNCLACHTRDSFLPSAFSLQQHTQSGFPLTGAHQEIECHACHWVPADPSGATRQPAAARVFRGTPTTCRGCHGDPHDGQFEYGPFAGGDCRACHNENAFRPPTFTIKQHNQTRFPLTGAHAAVKCDNCHPISKVRVGADGQTYPMRVFHDTPSACDTCHTDIHGGSFDRPGLPAVVDGREGCARCHGTDRFDWLWQGSFHHETWTGYKLVGTHTRAECAGCHERSEAGDSRGRSVGAVTGARCQSCHQDPHVGQFGSTVKVDCSRCHLVGESFAELAFSHQRDSRFPLDDEHVQLACSACHKPQPVRGWGTAVRYKPLGVVCGDCHDPRGQNGAARRNRR